MARYRGRHRKPTHTARNLTVLGTTGAFALGAGSATPEQAYAQQSAWDVIAECESDNRNVENSSGSSASGYWQIIDGTWRANGGLEFAPRALLASKAEQLVVAQRIATNRGSLADWNASKGCWGDRISSEVPQAVVAEPEQRHEEVAPRPQPVTPVPPAPRAEPEQIAELAVPDKPAKPSKPKHAKPDPAPSSITPGKPSGKPAAAPVTSGGGGSSTTAGNAVTDAAQQLLGVPYVWGGTTASGVDCSGLVNVALKAAGIDPPRTARALQTWVTPIRQSDAQPGDLFFWSPNGGTATHTGIYLGGNKIIEASQPGTVVTIRDVYSGITFGRTP
ncbi:MULTISPECIES: C40 family peptidase [Pseudonocardia]|uniref:Murein DD-endopeptidase MepH n=2 Tax=Pseudonocardia TaxID=1847 RepID=A0A1Y2N7P8_PSEAH|nr:MULTISPECIES: NlpC/P60 family protein [Pseudonocardia]OSY42938.1 Murein DD-endopeptidase MepH precursor [Pseudonocardia autotrophica]TDN77514.1 cell wall-associated NlpC family hydrolase [Pseudonocardia autotrophica]BBG01539.1 hypothetical protein Pdca_27480 [Pseudonocardia autotrophica]GEC25323.1 hypothetical protein PSA01_23520 [Pseudonocardia saturnea]